jgi:hypothetical protein
LKDKKIKAVTIVGGWTSPSPSKYSSAASSILAGNPSQKSAAEKYLEDP